MSIAARLWLTVVSLAIGAISVAHAETDLQQNLWGCTNGYGCDRSLLTPDQLAEVHRADLGRNLWSCTNGYSCDRSLLTQEQLAQVQRHEPYVGVTPACAENGSCYGDASEATGRPKTVHVKGYYRKDGTYVRGHYRSKPRR